MRDASFPRKMTAARAWLSPNVSQGRPGRSLALAAWLLALGGLSACSSDPSPTAVNKKPVHPMPSDACSLPGSVVFDDSGRHTVPGDGGSESFDWLTLPSGFCVHHFATVPVARGIRFAPGGELFVTSPSRSTAGGGINGLGAIVALPDDNGDGLADRTITYDSVAATQGMLFTPGYFYYQDSTQIRRVVYNSGDRAAPGESDLIADIQIYVSGDHWPKTLDVSDDGTMYVSNGGDQSDTCTEPYPFEGGILELDGTSGGNPIVKGLRNPMHLRCQHGHDLCFAVELARDLSAEEGGREKLFPIRKGDDWGHPCCATKDLPFSDIMPPPDCSFVTPESNSFLIGNTPFGFDFAPSTWPVPYANSIILTLHGNFAEWTGARIVAIGTDPNTGLPMPSSTVDGGLSGAISDFAEGWDDGGQRGHGRPADVTFSSDGRLFVADDYAGEIFWVAPVSN